MKDVFVGIDQSYSGFALCAYYPVAKDTQDCVWKYPPAKYGTGIDRLNSIEAELASTLYRLDRDGWIVQHVAMEGYAAARKFGREQAGELGAVVKRAVRAWLDPPACYPTIVPPTSLKKYVTGVGNAAKDNMLLGVFKKWGVEYTDNNKADAYGLARMAEAIHTGNTNFQYERDVLDKLHPYTEQFLGAA